MSRVFWFVMLSFVFELLLQVPYLSLDCCQKNVMSFGIVINYSYGIV